MGTDLIMRIQWRLRVKEKKRRAKATWKLGRKIKLWVHMDAMGEREQTRKHHTFPQNMRKKNN